MAIYFFFFIFLFQAPVDAKWSLCCRVCSVSCNVESLVRIINTVQQHLEKCHRDTVNRVSYVFKSKFCNNSFRLVE